MEIFFLHLLVDFLLLGIGFCVGFIIGLRLRARKRGRPVETPEQMAEYHRWVREGGEMPPWLSKAAEDHGSTPESLEAARRWNDRFLRALGEVVSPLTQKPGP